MHGHFFHTNLKMVFISFKVLILISTRLVPYNTVHKGTIFPRPSLLQWMLEELLWSIYEHESILYNTRHDRNVARTLTKDVQRSLLVDSRKRAERAAEDIGSCLELVLGTPQYPKRAYTSLKRWYRHASTRAPNPSREDMAKATGDYDKLYQ